MRRIISVLLGVISAIIAGWMVFPAQRNAAAVSPASSADRFVDSIGVNIHVSYTREPYWQRWDETKSALIALGVRHFRDRVADCSQRVNKVFCQHFEELGQAGMTGDFLTAIDTPMSLVAALPSQLGNVFNAFEGPNEYDISGDPNWLARLTDFQHQLYSTVKDNPALAKYPVFGPSIGHFENYAKAGDLSSYFDYGNLHNYLGPSNPGMHTDGRIRVWVETARSVNGTKPIVTTETGYWDGPSDKRLPFAVYPDAIVARYYPRLFLEQFKIGIMRTYQYEFLDDTAHLDSLYAHGGLLTAELVPKPQYNALKNLISLLKDPGPEFTPGSLDYEIDGDTDHLEHVLLAKRNGSMYLALWLEKPSFDLRDRRDTAVPAQRIKLTVHDPIGSATTVTFEDSGQTTNRPLSFDGQSATLSVGDRVVIVSLHAK